MADTPALRLVGQNEPFWAPSAKQLALIEAMTTPPYPNISAAAEAAGIAWGTAKRWNRDVRFRDALAQASKQDRTGAQDDADRKLRSLIGPSIAVQIKALQSKDLRVALRASEWVLKHFLGPAGAGDKESEADTAFEDAILAAVTELPPDARSILLSQLRKLRTS